MHFLINIPVISFFSVDFSINVVDNVVIIIYVTITIIIIIITIINIIIIRKQWLRLVLENSLCLGNVLWVFLWKDSFLSCKM